MGQMATALGSQTQVCWDCSSFAPLQQKLSLCLLPIVGLLLLLYESIAMATAELSMQALSGWVVQQGLEVCLQCLYKGNDRGLSAPPSVAHAPVLLNAAAAAASGTSVDPSAAAMSRRINRQMLS